MCQGGWPLALVLALRPYRCSATVLFHKLHWTILGYFRLACNQILVSVIGSGLVHCNGDNFDQTFSGFCFQVWGPKHITVLYLPQHEISSLPDLGEPPHQAASITISPGQKQTLGHGFFMVQRHLWVQINLSWQRNQLPSSSLWSSHISSYQLYFIFSLLIHLCMPIGSRNPC